MDALHYSFIVPVFNRPDEIKELLQSFLAIEGNIPFEIVIIEDGSTIDCKAIVKEYEQDLNISYYFKPNSGPGDSRNFGMPPNTLESNLDMNGLSQGAYFVQVTINNVTETVRILKQ